MPSEEQLAIPSPTTCSPAIEASYSHGSPSTATAVISASLPTSSAHPAATALEPIPQTNPLTIDAGVITTRSLRRCSRHLARDMGWHITGCAEEEDVAHEEAT